MQARYFQGGSSAPAVRRWPAVRRLSPRQPAQQPRYGSRDTLGRVRCMSGEVEVRRFAVLGGGFAGVSVAWHLLQHTSATAGICVELYDEGGIGAGASGVSGGLLHPYTPKGKLLWKGAEGFAASLKLLDIAESYSRSEQVEHGRQLLKRTPSSSEPLAWRRGILRPVLDGKHAAQLIKMTMSGGEGNKQDEDLRCIDNAAAEALMPGLQLPREDGVALHIPCGVTVHPKRYLEALWTACKKYAQTASASGCVGTEATLHLQTVPSLSSLAGRYEAVVVCLGARACVLPELAGKLPITFCRGLVADVQLKEDRLSKEEGEAAASKAGDGSHKEEEAEEDLRPSVLVADTWISIQGRRNMIVGATKEWNNPDLSPTVSAEEADAAWAVLSSKARGFFPAISSRWEMVRVRGGVRAVPPRTPLGALPIAGRIASKCLEMADSKDTVFWVFGGLGARGLVYHALVGKQVADAAVEADDASIFPELRYSSLFAAACATNSAPVGVEA